MMKIILIADDLNPADILILKRRREMFPSQALSPLPALPLRTLRFLPGHLKFRPLVSGKGLPKTSAVTMWLLDADHGVLTVHPDPSLLPQVAQRIRDLNNARIRKSALTPVRLKPRTV